MGRFTLNFLNGQKYPVDKTGVSPDNRVASEKHDVSPTYNVIVPVHAPFFAESMIVRFGSQRLVKDTDYKFDDLDSDASEVSNKPVYTTIVLTRNDIQGEVILDYQTYGLSNYAGVIAKYIKMFLEDNRGIDFNNLFNVPDKFPPIYHLHHVKDIVGIWPIILELQLIKQAIENLRYKGNVKFRAEIFEHITRLNEKFDNYRTMVADALELAELKATIRDAAQKLVDDTFGHIQGELIQIRTEHTGNYWLNLMADWAISQKANEANIKGHTFDIGGWFILQAAQERRYTVRAFYLGQSTTNVPVYGIFFKDKVIVLALPRASKAAQLELKVRIINNGGDILFEVVYVKDPNSEHVKDEQFVIINIGHNSGQLYPRVLTVKQIGVDTQTLIPMFTRAQSLF